MRKQPSLEASYFLWEVCAKYARSPQQVAVTVTAVRRARLRARLTGVPGYELSWNSRSDQAAAWRLSSGYIGQYEIR